ncbi:unnamed protein product [Schistocephalus solidus]|uniref:Large ribosomal subunit protein uL22m n=1 Tax=Schistocephalus solidus TaxID=70667 RepID=A0A183SM06_SCHSO|nr:unnamed protein product [Schistocephalus solidus]
MLQNNFWLRLVSASRLTVSAFTCLPSTSLFGNYRGFATRKALESDKPVTSRLTGKKTKLWDLYNEVVYPLRPSSTVHEADCERRPAEITFSKENILYSQKKLWLLAFMIRGLSVDEAFQQLGFRPEKGARILEEALEGAIERAVKEHDVEFCTELWIEKALVLRGMGVPAIHKGLRTALSYSTYHYANLFLRLREGKPPPLYHPYRIKPSWVPTPNCLADGHPGWSSPQDILEIELRKLRRRRIPGEL